MMLELRVLSGLHQGAALPLFGECWWIGAHEEADLALYDPGIEARHAQLHCMDGRWSVQAQKGLVQDEAGESLAHIADLALGVAFSLGGIRLCVADAGSAWPDEPAEVPFAHPQTAIVDVPGAASKVWKTPLFWALAVLALVFTGSSLWSVNEQPLTSQAPVDNNKRLLETAHEVQQQLLKMLSERELGNHISLEVAARQVTLRGNVLKEHAALVSRMLERFEAQFSTAVLISNRVGEMSPNLPFNIVQIIGGKKAHVVLAGGRRVFLGDEVEGLRLTRIDNHQLLFEGKQRYEVNW